MASFKSFALSPKMISCIEKIGYKEPSKVQELVIPAALRKESMVVTSETGSGKTHAFLIPIINNIVISSHSVQAIIVSPTRELARQTYDFAKEFCDTFKGLRVQLFSSQVEKNRNVNKLNNTPHIIIATPGRLLDLGLDDKNINLSTAQYVVLDEADMLMDMGFFDDINKLLEHLDTAAKMVFSATINPKLSRIIEKYIGAEHVITLENLTNNKVSHYAIDIRHQGKKEALSSFINVTNPYFLLVFASKKEDVNDLYFYLKNNGYNVGVIHGDLEKRERKNMMKRIKNLEFQIVVCSDMAARGIDIENVSDVLNVDLPKDLSFYFHRAGRTGRFYKDGKCYTFYDDDKCDDILKLQQQGVSFNYLVLKNDELKEGKAPNYKKEFRKKKDLELEKDIKRAVIETKRNTVKPGYKKAVKNAVEKVKRKHHRKMIKDNIRKQRVERYRSEARNSGR